MLNVSFFFFLWCLVSPRNNSYNKPHPHCDATTQSHWVGEGGFLFDPAANSILIQNTGGGEGFNSTRICISKCDLVLQKMTLRHPAYINGILKFYLMCT